MELKCFPCMYRFLQVKLSAESTDLTTFWTPVGFSSSPKRFQRRLSDALDDLNGVTVVADDILVCGKGQPMQKHKIMTTSWKGYRPGQKEKCKFLVDSLPYIGHVLTKKCVKLDSNKVTASKANIIPNFSAECEPQQAFEKMKTLTSKPKSILLTIPDLYLQIVKQRLR